MPLPTPKAPPPPPPPLLLLLPLPLPLPLLLLLPPPRCSLVARKRRSKKRIHALAPPQAMTDGCHGHTTICLTALPRAKGQPSDSQ